MKNIISSRRAASMVLVVVVLSIPALSLAQEPGGGQAPPPQAPTPPPQQPGQQPGGGGGGRQQPTVQPPSQERNQQQNQLPEMQRQIFLSGSVKLADGTPPPTSVVIERVCAGVVRPEAYTDSRGNFSFLLGGQNSMAIADASVGSDSMSRGGFQANSFNLAGCELRANLPGFQSDSVLLAFRNPLDNPDVGIIHIRRLANVEGYTFSITTALAPKDARKAYEKGLDHVKKKKWLDAERELTKAVTGYPKYALAWYELGLVYQQQKKLDDAARAHTEAIKIDPKFVNPYAQLAVVAVVQQKWDDVAGYTSQLVKLNPYVAPEIYFYSAVANYNLKKMDVAEDHARHAAKLDADHKTPRINHLLGLILAQKEDYKDAAENMRIYLQFSPNANDVGTVKEQLAEIESLIKQ
jgi:tetratricopeptide (TPR) repeat protein